MWQEDRWTTGGSRNLVLGTSFDGGLTDNGLFVNTSADGGLSGGHPSKVATKARERVAGIEPA
jgi:hypothetical protein